MSKIKIPNGVTHYFERPGGIVAYFLDSKTGTIFYGSGRFYTKDNVWKGKEGIERLATILPGCKMGTVNTRLENK